MVLSYSERQKLLKKKVWTNSNKMLFESAHKTFNKQTTLITTGNAIGNTQTSFFIRPYKTPKNPVGEKVSFGSMQDYDLNQFRNLPNHVRESVKKNTKTKDGILYKFFHYDGDRQVVHGYVLTDGNYNLIRKFYTNPSWKSQDVVDKVSEYVAISKKKGAKKLGKVV